MKAARLSVALDENTKERVEALAARHGVSRTQEARRMLAWAAARICEEVGREEECRRMREEEARALVERAGAACEER